MRIAWVSSWPPSACGIATYSRELVEEIRKLGHEVIVVCHTDGGERGEKDVYPVIQLNDPGWCDTLYRTVIKINPDLVHIQHEYGLYRRENDYSIGLISPVYRWNVEKRFPLVITYHSVYSRLDRQRALYMSLTLRIIQAGIVHEEYQKINLPYNLGWVPENVWVIPHGAKILDSYSKEEAKEKLGLDGKKVVGMIGWFAPTKGYHRVIDLWEEVVKNLSSDAVLVLAGETRPKSDYGEEYKRKLLNLISTSGGKEKIKLILKVFDFDEYNLILSSFDVVILPYTFVSQSGCLAHALSLGVPIIASGIEGLKEEMEKSKAGIIVSPEDNTELKRAIITMLEDNNLRNEYSKRAKEYVRCKISWQKIAGEHIKLYRQLLENF